MSVENKRRGTRMKPAKRVSWLMDNDLYRGLLLLLKE